MTVTPSIGDFRGEGEGTEMWNGGAWVPTPYAREQTAHYYGYLANIEAMKADGRWEIYLEWVAKNLERIVT